MTQDSSSSRTLRKVIVTIALLGLLWVVVSIPCVAAWNLSRSVAASCLLIGMNLMGVSLVYVLTMPSLKQSRMVKLPLAIFLFYAAYGMILNPIRDSTPTQSLLLGAGNGLLGLLAFVVITYVRE